MKSIIQIILFLSLTNFAYSQNSYKVKISVVPSLSGKKVYLQIQDMYSLNRYYKIDSAIVKDSVVAFQGSLTKPCEFAILSVKQANKVLAYKNLILDAGANRIAITENPTKYFPYQITAIGSKSNLIYDNIDSLTFKYYDDFGVKESGTTMRFLTKVKGNELMHKILSVLNKHPNDYISLIEAYRISTDASMFRDYEPALDTYNTLSDEIKKSPLGKEFYKVQSEKFHALNAAKTGQQISNFEIRTDNDGLFKNSSLKGKPYIIAFSATWCIPCQQYQKTLLSLYHKYKGNGLRVVYFNLDNDVIKWKKHINEKKLNWINVSERTKFKDSKIAQEFNVAAIPLYLIVNKEGKIVYNADEMKDENYTQLESYIKAVL